MVSYQKCVVKHGMGIFYNATKSCEKFRCFDENRVRLSPTKRNCRRSFCAGRFGMRSANGLRHPASASCLGRHLRLAGRCPNNSSLFPPLAAVVVVALCASIAEEFFYFGIAERLRTLRYPIFTGEVQRKPFSIVLQQKGAAARARQFLGSRYYALWDVGCVWKIAVMGDQPTRRSKNSLTHLKFLVTSLPLLSRTVNPTNFPVLSILGSSVYLLSFAS